MPLCRILSRQGDEIRCFSTDSLPVGAVITIGRSQSCTIPLKHEAARTVSREHLQLEHRHLGWVLINRSSHGTYKGDHSIDQASPKPGDVFHFGGCVLCYGPEAQPSIYQLHWQDDNAGGEAFALLWPGRNSVGQLTSNSVVLPDESVSRQHARITVTDDEITIEDLNSFVGTFANEKRVTSPTKLGPTARLRFGRVHAWVKVAPVAGAGHSAVAVRSRPLGSTKRTWVIAAVWIILLVALAIVLLATLA